MECDPPVWPAEDGMEWSPGEQETTKPNDGQVMIECDDDKVRISYSQATTMMPS